MVVTLSNLMLRYVYGNMLMGAFQVRLQQKHSVHRLAAGIAVNQSLRSAASLKDSSPESGSRGSLKFVCQPCMVQPWNQVKESHEMQGSIPVEPALKLPDYVHCFLQPCALDLQTGVPSLKVGSS